MATYGRGGAGNIKSTASPKLEPVDLQTPTIKSALYTTGRGGSGNMAINNPDNPAETRAAQDVETPAHHSKEMQGTYHWGRGGEGNMTTVGKSESEQRKSSKEREKRERTASREKLPERRNSFQQAINKGKEMLGLKEKPKDVSLGEKDKATVAAIQNNDSAIE